MFRAGGSKGPCPICGAPEQSCGGGVEGPRGAVGAGFFVGGSAQPAFPWRSREPVDEPDPVSGLTVQKYGIGTPIPLVEALRQGVARWEDLDAADTAALRRHGVVNPATQTSRATVPPPQEQPQEPEPQGAGLSAAKKGKRKGPDRPEKDKMVREGQVVRK